MLPPTLSDAFALGSGHAKIAARRGFPLVASLCLWACNPDDDAPAVGGSTSSITAGTDSSSGDGSGSTPTSLSASPISAGQEGSSGDSGEPTTSTGETGGDCILGSLGCACNVDWCEEGLTCTDGTCQEPGACGQDPYESNEDESNAANLAEVADNGAAGVMGVLDGPDDVDWFVYNGNDDLFQSVHPKRELTSSKGLRLCKFLDCIDEDAETEIECPDGTNFQDSPDGRPGCCAHEGFELPSLNCTGLLNVEDNAWVYIRVDQPAAGCVDYSLMYSY